LLHLAEDDVGGRVENSVKSVQMNGGQLIEQRKDGDAVHHRGFEQEALAARGSQIAEFAVSVNDGAFVSGDGVGSVLESGADVIGGGLTVLYVKGCGFEENVGAGGGKPAFDIKGLRPQGLKPFLFEEFIGTAKAVPFPVVAQG